MTDFTRSLFGFGKRTDSAHASAGGSAAATATNSRAGSVSVSHDKDKSREMDTDMSSSTTHSAVGIGSIAAGVSGADVEAALSQLSEQADMEPTILGKFTVRILEAEDLTIDQVSGQPYVALIFGTSQFLTASVSASPDSIGIAIPNAAGGDTAIHDHNSSSLFGRSNSMPDAGRLLEQRPSKTGNPRHPIWKEEVQFDVTSQRCSLRLAVLDAVDHEKCYGVAEFEPEFQSLRASEQWLRLRPRGVADPNAPSVGQIRINMLFERVAKKHYTPEDFQVLKMVGKGTFGKVYLVVKKDTKQVYAMKKLSKRTIVQKREVAHTIGERNILVRAANANSPFVVGLKFSFQTPTDLYFVTDYMSGGELFWHLQKEGRFNEERAKFYIAELILALETLHDNDIVYRDLKPENILLDAHGHIALCDFGLSKANPTDGRTNTFCGTTEYLAPEVLLDDKGYTKMVDFWSLGVLIFEMCCGWSPFYAEDNQQMYKNIAFGKVRFPRDALSVEGRNFVKGLLNRNPKHRLGATDDTRELRAQPFFADMDWELLRQKRLSPPFVPTVSSDMDTSNFDPEFTQTPSSVLSRSFLPSGSTPLSPSMQANFQGFTYVDHYSLDDRFRPNSGSGLGPSSRLRGSYIPHDDDIDLYDDHDIEMSRSHVNESILAQRIARDDPESADDDDEMQTEQEDMMVDDEHEFVNAQNFEL